MRRISWDQFHATQVKKHVKQSWRIIAGVWFSLLDRLSWDKSSWHTQRLSREIPSLEPKGPYSYSLLCHLSNQRKEPQESFQNLWKPASWNKDNIPLIDIPKKGRLLRICLTVQDMICRSQRESSYAKLLMMEDNILTSTTPFVPPLIQKWQGSHSL